MKEKEFDMLIKDLANCTKCTNLNCSHKSLVNLYSDYNFCLNVPSIWTDRFNRLDKKLMIIGQDWGPYEDMKKLNNLLNEDKSNWKDLIDEEKSNTKRMLDKYIRDSSGGQFSLEDAFITNAIMCARQGKNYRGENIALKESTINCSRFILRQIEIVKPQIILTLGYYPLLALAYIFNFEIEKTLKETIAKMPEIIMGEYVIIPLYHPVAQIRASEQLEQYQRIWKYMEKKGNE